VRVGEFVRDFAIPTASSSVANDPVDKFGEGKDGTPPGDADTDDRNENEERFEEKFGFSEKREAEVDENEILRELSQDLKDEFCGELGASGHVVVGIMFHANTAEEERDDA
jgi:hypothetical protein